jgi:TrpR-related protein YerC/YecD
MTGGHGMVNKKLRTEQITRLFEAILCLENVEEAYRFFEDLCTVGELQSLAQRFEVAKLLASGMTYDKIVARTGMSTATISRIKRCLDYGADGYRLVLERLEKS